jgi:hypothetical protein
MELIPFRNKELLIIGGVDYIEFLLIGPNCVILKKSYLMKLSLTCFIRFYPTSGILVLAQSKSSIYLFRIKIAETIKISKYYSLCVDNVKFIYYNSLFLFEELEKDRVILCIPTKSLQNNVKSTINYIIVEENKGIKQVFYFDSSHNYNITSIIRKPGQYEVVLGDKAGFISKHKVIPDEQYSTISIKKPINCMNEKIYMINFCKHNKFLFVGNEYGLIKIIDYETFNCVRTISMPSSFVKYFYIQTLDNFKRKKNGKLLINRNQRKTR